MKNYLNSNAPVYLSFTLMFVVLGLQLVGDVTNISGLSIVKNIILGIMLVNAITVMIYIKIASKKDKEK